MHALPCNATSLAPAPLNMKTRILLAIALCGVVLAASSCRKGRNTKNQDQTAAVIAPELQSNGLGVFPGAVYHNQVDSPIHWQPWTKESLTRAKDAHRLVFCVIAMPQQPVFQTILANLAHDPAIVAAINEHYVPILIDGDAAREMGLLTADLCSEIKRPLQLPLLVWLTYEGNPVAWIPVGSGPGPSSVVSLFNQSHLMVTQMWADSPSYMLKNSSMDNNSRRVRFKKRGESRVVSEQPAVDVVRSIRQLASLYDSFSRNFDEVGGLLPSGALELLATAATQPGLPSDVRARSLATIRELMLDILPSAMFDPLDGGVFAARSGGSWSMPAFARDCPGQARAAVALLQVYRATGDAKVLDKALGVLGFAEKSYLTDEGLFAIGLTPATAPNPWMWSIEEIEKELAPDDAAWWIKATRMQGLGNLPSEADPLRAFFRYNTVALAPTLAELAAGQSQSLADFTPRFEAVKARLLAARQRRFGQAKPDQASHAGATFRMVSAYASAFGVTGEDHFRAQAVALLQRARQSFGVGSRLRVFSKSAPDSLGAGRGFLYALALQAALDVAAITSDESWVLWSEDLAATAAELLVGDHLLKECPDDATLIDLAVTDPVMLFDDSTAGLMSLTEVRLADRSRPLAASLSNLTTPLPSNALERPILHTDLLLATLARHFKVSVVLGTDTPVELKRAIERLPMRTIQRRQARPDDQVPAGSVQVRLASGVTRLVTTPTELLDVVQPSQ